MSKGASSRTPHCSESAVWRAENAAETEAEKSAPDVAEAVAVFQAETTRPDKASGVASSPSLQEGTLQDRTRRAKGTEPDTAGCPGQDGADAELDDAAAASKPSVDQPPAQIDPQDVPELLRTSKNPLIQAIRNYKPPPDPEVKVEELEKHLEERLAALLTEMSHGPAAAAACLRNPKNVRSAVLLWRKEAMRRAGDRGPGKPPDRGGPWIPPPCFTWLTRALMEWARQHGLQVSGMKEFWEKTTVNVALPPETHQYCSLDYCGLDHLGRWKLWQTAAAEADQLDYAAQAEAAENERYSAPPQVSDTVEAKTPANRPPKTSGRISPEDRTILMSYRKAAKLMGKGTSQDAAEWLSKRVAGSVIACEHLSRQNHVFSKRDFPESVWQQILPQRPPQVNPTQPNST